MRYVVAVLGAEDEITQVLVEAGSSETAILKGLRDEETEGLSEMSLEELKQYYFDGDILVSVFAVDV